MLLIRFVILLFLVRYGIALLPLHYIVRALYNVHARTASWTQYVGVYRVHDRLLAKRHNATKFKLDENPMQGINPLCARKMILLKSVFRIISRFMYSIGKFYAFECVRMFFFFF